MKKIALLSLLCTPLLATHVWADTNGKTALTTPTTAKSTNNLIAHLVILPGKGEEARKNWNGSNTKVTDTVRQGSAISILIAFSDCTANAKGLCDVNVEYFVAGPDGDKKPGGSGSVWSGAPVSIPGISILGQASLTAGFDSTDPVGTYTVFANVTDKVSGKVLHLSQNFKVTK